MISHKQGREAWVDPVPGRRLQRKLRFSRIGDARNVLSMQNLYFIGAIVLGLFVFVLAIVISRFFGLWLRAWIANAPVGMGKMIGMSLRKVPVGLDRR